MTYAVAKRCLDVVLSTVAIVLLSPVFVAVAALVRMTSRGPILYRGLRAGRHGKNFYIFKFRTMVVDAESKGGASTAVDDPRLTRIGRVLRKYKLDELPQFFNVLGGSMSLVGPRPQVLSYTDKYQGEERRVLDMRPGITDLASLYFSDMDKVLGSGDVDAKYAKEIEPVKNLLRLQYVDEASLFLDLRILIETAFKLVGVANATGLNVRPR
jgi:lipopolysaccharide/colanic/teichoic acid biosynthesis glycosyltransferase